MGYQKKLAQCRWLELDEHSIDPKKCLRYGSRTVGQTSSSVRMHIYCMCTYFSRIHSLAELALDQEYANIINYNDMK